MDLPGDEAIARLKAVPSCVAKYVDAFGTADTDRRGIGRAMAT